MWAKKVRFGYDADARLRIGLVPTRAGLRQRAIDELAVQHAQDDVTGA